MVISSHVFICRPPKILGWRGRICGIALHPIATGLVSLPTIYWPFQGSPQGRKKTLPLDPCLWQQGKTETVAKLSKHASITSKIPGWANFDSESLKNLLRTDLGAAVAAFLPGHALLGRLTMW